MTLGKLKAKALPLSSLCLGGPLNSQMDLKVDQGCPDHTLVPAISVPDTKSGKLSRYRTFKYIQIKLFAPPLYSEPYEFKQAPPFSKCYHF